MGGGRGSVAQGKAAALHLGNGSGLAAHRVANDGTNANRPGITLERDGRGVEATPLVIDGVMYVTSAWSIVYALDARIDPPEMPGQAVLQLTAVQEDRSWFELHGFSSVDLNVEILDFTEYARCSVEPLHALPDPRAGEQLLLAVRLRNAGAQVWPAQGSYPARVSYHLYAADGSLLHRDGLRTNLPHDLNAGDSRVIFAQVKMPVTAGSYVLEWTVVQDRVAWFEQSKTFQTARVCVEVGEPIPIANQKDTAARAKQLQAHAQAIERWRYADWIDRYDTLHPEDVRLAQRLMSNWPRQPLISILMPCFNSPEPFLREAIESVLAQLYPHWELCIADDASTEPYVRPLLDEYAARDARIRVTFRDVNGHISAASNTALEMAQGEFCLLLDHDDRLAAHALFVVAGEILRDGRLEWIYYDLDNIDEQGQRYSPHFKSGPNPDLFLGVNFMAAHATYLTERLKSVGGFRLGYEGSQDHDLGLRVLESIGHSQISHIPHILYHWRAHSQSVAANFLQKPYAYASGVRAVSDYLQRRGVQAKVEILHHVSGYRIRYPLPDPAPLVSIIIPTRDRLDLLRRCIGSILHKTRYPNYEILLIDNQSNLPETLRYFEYLTDTGIAHIIHYDHPFNWSGLNNIGVQRAKGEVICLLNNDTEVITESWLDEMVSHAVRPEIGIVGAALWHYDNMMQHGGVVMGFSGVAAHLFNGLHRRKIHTYRAHITQNFSAVTGACMTMRKSVYTAVEGMNERYLPVAFNDVDFCLRVQSQLNLRVLWTPFAELYHHEQASRGKAITDPDQTQRHREVAYINTHWLSNIENDVYFSPNLALDPSYKRADPPRILLRKSIRAYHFSDQPKLAFMHIPKTAGVALRKAIKSEYPDTALLVVSGKENMLVYDRDPEVLSAIRQRANRATVWFSHFSYGFGELLDLQCTYLTFLRDPVQRVISHYRYLMQLDYSPINHSVCLQEMSLETMLRKGIIASNLMVKQILGQRPEKASWDQIEKGGRAYAGNFCGFSFPVEVWTEEDEKLLALPDQAPENDPAWVEQAIETIQNQFAFVGRQENLDEHVSILGERLGWDQNMKVPKMNLGSKKFNVEIDENLRQLIEHHNQLDRKLYEYIINQPNGYWINELLLKKF